MKSSISNKSPKSLVAISALALASCAQLPVDSFAIRGETDGRGFQESAAKHAQTLQEMLANIPAKYQRTDTRRKAMLGLDYLAKGDLQQGSKLLNTALQLEPNNSYLQFFNAYAYHLMARQGDSSKASLAAQGYSLAARFDPSNWIAHDFLGMLHYEQREYKAAQDEFAQVLLFREHDRSALLMMVASSYYIGDAVTANACLNRLVKDEPNNPEVLRLLTIVNAALGRDDIARGWLERYRATHPSAADLQAIEPRVKHWGLIHRQPSVAGSIPEASLDKTKPLLGDALASRPEMAPEIVGGKFMRVKAAATEEGEMSQGTMEEVTAEEEKELGQLESGASNVPTPASSRMLLVDVVLMYTQDTLSTSQGVNLMNMLSLQFGDANNPAFSKTFTNTTSDGVSTATSTLTRAITIPALTYSLNIANASTIRDEVLARPTLAALDGTTSKFFAGSSLDAAVVASGSNSGGSVQIQKEIGVALAVTPKFLPDGKVLMNVNATRTFVRPPSTDIAFTYKLETSKIQVDANVVMKFGETLVLGGLSEKETTQSRNGVPLLQDIPLVQYLFSQKSANNYQHSVLMLITPRLPAYTFKANASDGSTSDVDANDATMKEFRARFGDWFSPYPNMASVFHHLNKSTLYREFRTGDVNLEHWDQQSTVSERLKQALGFLFY